MYAVFSPDGQTIATACNEDKTARLWRTATGRLSATLSGHHAGITRILFAPDGNVLATESLDDTVKLWDARTGELKGTLAGHGSTIYQTEFSPDGRFLATASRDRTAILWDVPAGRLKYRLSGFDGIVLRVSFSPDSRRLAVSGGYKQHLVKVWEIDTGRLMATFEGHQNDIEELVFSPNGNLLVTASKESARVWNSVTGDLIRQLEGARYPVAFSHDGRMLATRGETSTVLLWNASVR